MRLLLMSNSIAPGRGYLEHAHEVLTETLGGVGAVTFIPFALKDHDAYTEIIATGLRPLGVKVIGAHTAKPADLVRRAEAVFVGGGNTFRLVQALYRTGLMEIIKARVADGLPYIGSSAGTNVAGPTMRTTNDMPIVQPPSFETLNLVPVQINPHYIDPPPDRVHMGETREERLLQFLEENDVPVVGLREGTWLERSDAKLTLGGIDAGARLFQRGAEPRDISPGTDLSHLLSTRPRFDATDRAR
ncbi:dipeptidase PepE [Phytoactinopolyspora alkaliphila]|uniref:dipeptidase E n=1 Tax=Phytoactinopolyspora alkaliphila TaxID=1783498 RepID=A0A6N9YLE6_9ACTN|nr:dipeptidase PepE [Phytoactinopolyspora alkaliphila]NED95785.1 dipeptidase PepE [Phytoactinopolyspora alkaliphila]